MDGYFVLEVLEGKVKGNEDFAKLSKIEQCAVYTSIRNWVRSFPDLSLQELTTLSEEVKNFIWENRTICIRIEDVYEKLPQLYKSLETNAILQLYTNLKEGQ